MQCVQAIGWRQVLSLRRGSTQFIRTQPIFYRPQHISRPQFSTISSRWQQALAVATEEDSTVPESLPSPHPSRARQSAKLNALHARLALPSRLPPQTLARALVDKTADPDARFNNESLAVLGADLLAYYISEHLICHYPRLPMDVLLAAVSAYVGPKALAQIAKEWGVDAAAEPGGEVDPGFLQLARVLPGEDPSLALGPNAGRPNEEKPWRRGLSSRVVYDDEFGQVRKSLNVEDHSSATTLEDASASFVRAVVGAIYLHAGRPTVKRFVQNHFQSRTLNLSTLFSFTAPTRDLSRLCLREAFESPVARLESETGRLSRHPVFVVGVYSGRDKLGEGAGASLDEARVRAATAALKGWYLYSPMDVTCPSEAEDSEGSKKWKPNMVDMGEIIT